MRILILGTAILLGTSACSSLPESGSDDARRYASRCGACHDAVQPKDHHRFQWERLLTLIERGVLHREMKPALSSEEKAILLQYLSRHAMPDPKEADISLDRLPQ